MQSDPRQQALYQSPGMKPQGSQQLLMTTPNGTKQQRIKSNTMPLDEALNIKRFGT
jgi:hypothetical protein